MRSDGVVLRGISRKGNGVALAGTSPPHHMSRQQGLQQNHWQHRLVNSVLKSTLPKPQQLTQLRATRQCSACSVQLAVVSYVRRTILHSSIAKIKL